jgi:recombination protein RecT
MSDNNITIKQALESQDATKKFKDLLGDKSTQFVTSVLSVVNNNELLLKSDWKSIYNAAITAATLDLPINQNLGFAYIIPYGGEAQFQIGYKGFIQLAIRSQEYLRLTAIPVYQNQFKSWNALTEELDGDFSIDGTGRIVGYCAYFKLKGGYEKFVFWSTEKITKHGEKFSKNFNTSSSLWKKDFEAMALKTVIKHIISKWGPMSTELQKAIESDQAIIRDNGYDYADSTSKGNVVDARSSKETGDDLNTSAKEKITVETGGGDIDMEDLLNDIEKIPLEEVKFEPIENKKDTISIHDRLKLVVQVFGKDLSDQAKGIGFKSVRITTEEAIACGFTVKEDFVKDNKIFVLEAPDNTALEATLLDPDTGKPMNKVVFSKFSEYYQNSK